MLRCPSTRCPARRQASLTTALWVSVAAPSAITNGLANAPAPSFLQLGVLRGRITAWISKSRETGEPGTSDAEGV